MKSDIEELIKISIAYTNPAFESMAQVVLQKLSDYQKRIHNTFNKWSKQLRNLQEIDEEQAKIINQQVQDQITTIKQIDKHFEELEFPLQMDNKMIIEGKKVKKTRKRKNSVEEETEQNLDNSPPRKAKYDKHDRRLDHITNQLKQSMMMACDKCPFQCQGESDLEDHIYKIHSIQDVNINEEWDQYREKNIISRKTFAMAHKYYTCPTCAVTMMGANRYKLHLQREHQVNYWYICPDEFNCGYKDRFTTPFSKHLKSKHSRIGTRGWEYECPYTKKVWRSRTLLRDDLTYNINYHIQKPDNPEDVTVPDQIPDLPDIDEVDL